MIGLGNYAERHSKTLTESVRYVANLCRLADIEVFAIGPFDHFEVTQPPRYRSGSMVEPRNGWLCV